jgi:hypothetical protein
MDWRNGKASTRLGRALRQRLFVYRRRTDTMKACGYVDDLVSSMIERGDRNESYFLYNFCHPRRTSKEICSALARVAGYPEPQLFWASSPPPPTFGGLTDIDPGRTRSSINRRMLSRAARRGWFQLLAMIFPQARQSWKHSSQVTGFD